MAPLATRHAWHVMLTVLALTLVAPIAPAAAEDEPPPPPPPARLATPEIFGYLTYWGMGARIDYGAITTIAYFSLEAGADGMLVRSESGITTTQWSRWMGSAMTSVIEQAHANGVRVVLTVERFSWTDADTAETAALLNDPVARATLATDIAETVRARGVDGVSLDFEPIPSSLRDQFALFVRELRAALDAVDPVYQLTFAATGWQSAATYDMMGDLTNTGAADAIVIMGYPMRGTGASRAGGLAPITSSTVYDLTDTVTAYLARTTGDRIILALPWYGRQWSTTSDELNARQQTDKALYGRPAIITYQYSLPVAIAHGRAYDPVEHSAWTSYRWRACAGCPMTWRQMYYEDVETLGYKYDWAASRGLRGVGVWALGFDGARPEMWKLLRVKYRGLVDTDPPTGTLGLSGGAAVVESSTVPLALGSSDGADGSGVVFLRVSNMSDVTDGVLDRGRTYPVTSAVDWALDDAATGGSAAVGERTVFAQWRDVSGNWSAVSAITFEWAPPPTAVLTVAAGATQIAQSTVSVRVTHTGGRSIHGVKLSSSSSSVDGVLAQAVDAGAGTDVAFSLIDPATGGADVDGDHTVYAQWRDVDGRWSEVTGRSIVLDRAAPTGTLSVVGDPSYVNDPTIDLVAAGSDDGTGVTSVAFSNDGSTWSEQAPSDEPVAWAAGERVDGTWTIHARWQDGAGNRSDVATATVILDRAAPVGTVVLEGGAAATTADAVTVAADASDATSGVVELLISNTADTTGGQLTDGRSFEPGSVVDWTLRGAGTPGGVSEGMATVYAQWRDRAGNWSDVASGSIVVDRTAPTLGELQAGLREGGRMDGSTAPVVLTWSATDDGSGITSEALETSTDGSTWSSAGDTGSPTVRSVDLTVGASFRLTATDAAGNGSAAATSVSGRLLEESATDMVFEGAWSTVASASASGGAVRQSFTRGARVTMGFTGRAVAWVAKTGPKLGMARVLIDGVAVTKVDLGTPTARTRRLVFSRSWADSGTHTISVVVLGTVGRPRVEVDALVVID